jgi:hypothetical protein
MNERLEIAARIMAGIVTRPAAIPSDGNYIDSVALLSVRWADALIAAERETRPKCEHKNLLVSERAYLGDTPGGPCYMGAKARCADCGAEVKP